MSNILSLILVVLAMTSPANAKLLTSSVSGSCSGTHQRLGFFFAFTFQFASVMDGRLSTESHSFSFSGALSGMDRLKIAGVRDRHVIYLGDRYEMAVPFVAGAGLFVRERDVVGGPDDSGANWIKICSY